MYNCHKAGWLHQRFYPAWFLLLLKPGAKENGALGAPPRLRVLRCPGAVPAAACAFVLTPPRTHLRAEQEARDKKSFAQHLLEIEQEAARAASR